MATFTSHSLAQSLAAAGAVIGHVLEGTTLNAALASQPQCETSLRAATYDLACNALREYGFVDVVLGRLLTNPVKDAALRGLMLAALVELGSRPQHVHATVHQAVEAAVLLGQTRAKGLVNAVLREFQRQEANLRKDIEASEVGRYRHPQWWIDLLRSAHPRDWERVLAQDQVHPPMTLRVNLRRQTQERYLRILEKAGIPAKPLGPCGVRLTVPRRVDALPGFAEGEISVQDFGAQLAAPLLDVRDGMRVLDACAAPGGKCAHLLEMADCDLLALDVSPERLSRVEANHARLGLKARTLAADALAIGTLWPGMQFERILLDTPCTASGVVRRHPDIRWLRRQSDVAPFASTQSRLLEALWPSLAPDGKLLYATCSVFPQENDIRVRAFLERHPDADRLEPAGAMLGQILPDEDTDGFFYALIKKRS